jgi:hypothetical protein
MEMQSIPPRKVKVMKMSKGYQWEISFSSDAPFEDIIKGIKSADDQLKLIYGGDA